MRIVGVGAGGHAKVLLDAVRAGTAHEVVGLVAPERTTVLGLPVLGGDELLPALRAEGVEGAFIGIGELRARCRLFAHLQELRFTLVPIIHPDATVSCSVQLAPGLAVLAQAVLNPDVRLGVNVIVNTAAVVEHDCALGDHVHVAPRAVLCGGVVVGKNSHVGAGAVVREGIVLGRNVMVGAGAVVVRNVADGTRVMGVPARPC